MKHSFRAAVVWWLGCLGLVAFLVAAVTGFRVDLALGLPLAHLAIATMTSWLILLVVSWFGLFSWLAFGFAHAKMDVAAASLVFLLVLVNSVLGFLAWEDRERYTTIHHVASWLGVLVQAGALAWFHHRRQLWFAVSRR